MNCVATVALVYSVLALHSVVAFRAAVYEHVQQGNSLRDSGEVIVAKNLQKYAEATQNASRQGADIIVFPEEGILFFDHSISFAEDIPDPGDANPCLHEHLLEHVSLPILSNLSCMARKNRIYLVANVIDTKPCQNKSSCPAGGRLFYNTNVAFDRSGALVSRYHKNHLYVEPEFVQPDPPEFAIFETDFGRRVGMFICFDILFKEASELVTRFHIDVAVFSTWWFDELPKWFSVATQEAWSLRHNVPLLASGIQRPRTGSLGSGIYLGNRGPLIYTYSPDGKDKLLVADLEGAVPPNPRYQGDEVSPSRLVLVEVVPEDYVAVKLEGASGIVASCQRGFCCRLQYTASAMNDSFFLLVKNGYKRIQNLVSLGVQECTVARCEPKAGRPCGHFPYVSSTSFSQLELTAAFDVPDIFPVVVSNRLALTSFRSWHFNKTTANRATITLDAEYPPTEPLLSAVLLARVYKNDSPLNTLRGRPRRVV